MILATLALALATEWVFATLFILALRLGSRPRAVAFVVLCIPIALSPLWIPATAPIIRFIASLNAAVLSLKLYDLHVGAGLPNPVLPASRDRGGGNGKGKAQRVAGNSLGSGNVRLQPPLLRPVLRQLARPRGILRWWLAVMVTDVAGHRVACGLVGVDGSSLSQLPMTPR